MTSKLIETEKDLYYWNDVPTYEDVERAILETIGSNYESKAYKLTNAFLSNNEKLFTEIMSTVEQFENYTNLWKKLEASVLNAFREQFFDHSNSD